MRDIDSKRDFEQTCKDLLKKYYIESVDIFTGERHKFYFTDEVIINRLECNKTKWNVLSYDDDDYVTLMDEKGNIKQDLKLSYFFNEDIGQEGSVDPRNTDKKGKKSPAKRRNTDIVL